MNDQAAERGPGWHATTILMVRKGGRTVIGGDGQVSLGQTIVKGNARKVRRLAKGEVIAGSGQRQRHRLVGDDHHGLEPAQIAVGAPVFG